MRSLRIRILKGRFAICSLGAREGVPEWVGNSGKFTSVCRTAEELSMVCAEDAVPPGVPSECGWRILKIEGPLDFALTGILASVAGPLADAGVSIFAVSTFDTDYVLVKDKSLDAAVEALAAAGHKVAAEA